MNLGTVPQAEYCVKRKECGLKDISVKHERHCGSATFSVSPDLWEAETRWVRVGGGGVGWGRDDLWEYRLV